MFEDLFNCTTFFNMLEFDKIDYNKYLENFEDKTEILQDIIQYITSKETEVGIFCLYKIDRTILSSDLKMVLFTDEKYKTDDWFDTLSPYGYPIRVNYNDFLILKDELIEYQDINQNPYIICITFIPL